MPKKRNDKKYFMRNQSDKQSKPKKDKVTSLKSIHHKGSFGNSNWKKFMEMESLKSENAKVVTKKADVYQENKKLPLMKKCGVLNDKPLMEQSRSPRNSNRVTKVIGIDCEMVGVGEGGLASILARVSIVNSYGDCIYDKYVKSHLKVTDYRTAVSGIRPQDMENGEEFFKVQKEVADILKGRILVGHAIKHDLQVLILNHPRNNIRDTSTFMKFRNGAKGKVSLKNLASIFLNVNIQDGEHNSIEDARAALQLYMTYRKEWEKERSELWAMRKKSSKRYEVTAPVLQQS